MVLALQKLIFGGLIGLLIGHHHIQIMNHRGIDAGQCLPGSWSLRETSRANSGTLLALLRSFCHFGRVAREHSNDMRYSDGDA